jgi:hypothetical protein
LDRVHVATINIRNLMDRWAERLPLLLADMAALQPDLLGMQEVVFALQQDRIIGGRRGALSGGPRLGRTARVRLLDPRARTDRVERRGAARSRTQPRGPPGDRHPSRRKPPHVRDDSSPSPAGGTRRTRRAVAALVEWLDAAPPADAVVVTGDFNAGPREPAYGRMVRAGFRSAHLEAHGSEPAVTWPSGLIAPAMDTDGNPDCLDYIFIRGGARTLDCGLVFDRPAVDDPTLYPSDHLGLAAHLEIGGAL